MSDIGMSKTRHASCQGLELDFQVACAPRDDVPGAASFAKWASAALAGERGKAELSIRVVDDEEGRALNRAYRGKDYPTNVLSFPADIPEYVELPLLGDIVMCAPVVAAEAVEQGKNLQAHWAHLTVHGLLHLLGYDHLEDSEAQIMETREKVILSSLGFADPYMPADK
jgi:probable rRNA maturation factor